MVGVGLNLGLGGAGVGAGVSLGGLGAGAGLQGGLNGYGGGGAGAGIGVGGGAGAGGGAGVGGGADVNAAPTVSTSWGANGQGAQGDSAGIGAGADIHGNDHGNAATGGGAGVGAGVGVNGNGQSSADAGVGGDASGHHGGEAEAHGSTPETSPTLKAAGDSGNAVPGASASIGTGGQVAGEAPNGQVQVPAVGGSAGVGAGTSGQTNGNVNAGVGGGLNLGGGIVLSHLAGVPTDSASGPACTIQGGPARLLFFPPSGQAGGSVGGNVQGGMSAPGGGEAGATITTPPGAGGAPAEQTPLTAWGQTFSPGYAYISVETLYATLAGSGGAPGSTVGPTFTNAIIPFKSSEVSTGCAATMSGYSSNPASMDWASLAASLGGGQGDDHEDTAVGGCYNIQAPSAMAAIVPEWKNGVFWNIHFDPPKVLNSQMALQTPPPARGPACEGCPRRPSGAQADAVSPTIVPAGYGYNPTTAPAGVEPSPAGGYISGATVPTTPVNGGNAAPSGSIGAGAGLPNGTAAGPQPTQPAQYQGSASTMRGLKSGVLLGALLASIAWL